MLTVDYDRLGVRPGDRLLDLGLRRRAATPSRPCARGAHVVALDADDAELKDVGRRCSRRCDRRDVGPPVNGDALAPAVPRRRLRPGHRGRGARAHPRRHAPPWPSWPGCCARAAPWPSPSPAGSPSSSTGRCPTSTTSNEGGHVRIYRHSALVGPPARAPACATAAPASPTACTRRTGGSSARSACSNDEHPLVQAYHRLLVWDITDGAARHARWPTAVLSPVIGKSLVVYLEKPRC